MSGSYKKSCMYCNKEIEMSDQASGKWLPYNSDGSVHDCRNQNKNGHVKQEAPLSIEDRVKRLESIVLGGGSR